MPVPSALIAWQRTKIVCTLGPATDAPGVLEALVRSGMDVARINMSHGTHAEHTVRIERVRSVSQALAQPIAILADLPGPKFRIGTLDGGSRRLEDGMVVFLCAEARDSDCLPVRDHELLLALRAGESVYLADGAVELRVTASSADRVACEVAVGGSVRSGSGINAPESKLPGLVPTQADRLHIAFAVSHSIDWIGVSFVQSADDLARVRACIRDGHMPLLMAKIEKRVALMNLDEIVEAADGVMVARGDLGVETDLAEIPLAQKRVVAVANAKARPVVTATQMLESMVEHEQPTRAEVTDVANAVLDGTDAVMLSAESAIGRHPVAAVEVMQRVLAATEAAYSAGITATRPHAAEGIPPDAALAFAACQLADRVGAKAIIAPVRNQAMASAIGRFRPAVPILALSASQALCRSLVMLRGVFAIDTSEGEDAQAHISRASKWLFAHALARSGDRAVVISSTGEDDEPDTLRVVTFRD